MRAVDRQCDLFTVAAKRSGAMRGQTINAAIDYNRLELPGRLVVCGCTGRQLLALLFDLLISKLDGGRLAVEVIALDYEAERIALQRCARASTPCATIFLLRNLERERLSADSDFVVYVAVGVTASRLSAVNELKGSFR